MDEHRQFLEAQVQDSESRLNEASEAIKKALDAFDASLDDAVTWQKALEKYTRNSENPYYPPTLSNPFESLLASRVAKENTPEVKPERPRGEEKPRVQRITRKFSKRGAVRALLEAIGTPMDVSEVAEALANQDLPEPITKYDLYRILPNLYSRREIDRDARGKYSAHPKVLEENSLLDGIKEPVM